MTVHTSPVLVAREDPATRPWLLFHGWGQSGHYWIPMARWLPRGADLRWVRLAEVVPTVHGAPGSMERTEQIVAHVGREQLNPEVIIGHSAGAVTALCAAARWPDVRAVALVEPLRSHLGPSDDSPARPPRDLPTPIAEPQCTTAATLAAAYPLAAGRVVAVIAAALDRETGSADAHRAVRPPGGRATDRAARMWELMHHLEIPVTVVRGAVSSFCDAEDADFIASGFSRSPVEVRTIERAGHSPHIDNPRQTAAALLAAAGLVDGVAAS